MQRVVFHEKIPAFLTAYNFFPPKDRLKSLRQVKIFIQKKKNYVLSRNVADLLNIFSLIVFAVTVKALKSDLLC